ncbi:MAG: DUF4199 domain-containing protein [Paraglaciecola sp.]|nr:DUF4199 domain-containing protein [Paraglaciecola sp.]NCT49488.1 DUF4199 domain-containing protein [Paraglaciecola sp.]
MFRSIWRFGLIYGLALGIGFFASHLWLGSAPENFSTGEVVGYSVIIISSLAIIFGVLEYKRDIAPLPLGFLRGVGIGCGISLIAAFIFALYNWVYLEYINPQFTATYIEYMQQQVNSSAATAEEKQQQLSELASYGEMMASNVAQALVMFATVFVVGVVFSLASALLLRSEKPKSN